MLYEFVLAHKVVLVSAVNVIPLIVMEMEQVDAVFLVQVVVWHLDVTVFIVWIQQPLGVVELHVDARPHPVVLLGYVIATCPHVVARENWDTQGIPMTCCSVKSHLDYVTMVTVCNRVLDL